MYKTTRVRRKKEQQKEEEEEEEEEEKEEEEEEQGSAGSRRGPEPSQHRGSSTASTREIFSEVSPRTDLGRFFDSCSKKRGNKGFLIGSALAGERVELELTRKTTHKNE